MVSDVRDDRKFSLLLIGTLAIVLAASGTAFGQAQTGNIFAKATDDAGAPLPGVSVTLTGIGAAVSQVTDVAGDVRFPSRPPGEYTLEFSLSGFSKVTRNRVFVAVGQNTQINTTMKLSGVQQSVVVLGESPLLDTRKTGSQTTVSAVEMSSVPTARDPWVILQTAPGVSIDRVNVGGSESGQQSGYIAKGAASNQGTWNVDGINITDMGALGSSPAYYDFDSFQEMNLAVGGSDPSIQTSGAQVNMVTKRGTNDVHGSARLYYEDKKVASTNTPDELIAQQQAIGNAGSGNQVDSFQDAGVEVGGPIIKDKLWLWGSYNRNQINLITAGGSPDKTTLLNFGGKLNAQIVPENTFTASYLDNDKQKLGRQGGPTHPPETTLDQSGPTKLYKLEDSHIFTSDVFATASYSRVMGGFQLISEGRSQQYIDAAGVYHNSYYDYHTQRPQTQASIQPSFFLRTGSMGHEFKVGFNYRKTPITTTSSMTTGLKGVAADAFGTPYNVAGFERPRLSQTDAKSYAAYFSDTITVNKLTANIGVRYDYQQGQNTPGTIPCCLYNPAVWPQVPMTDLAFPGRDPLTWKDFSPRIGLTYAVGDDNKTLVRASYARFVNQMGSGDVTLNSFSPGATYLYYEWNDKNGNKRVDPGEVNFNNLVSYFNWDPAHPNSVSVPQNQINYNMKTPKTDEFILGVEHELLPAFVVGVQGTYRRASDFEYNARLTADKSRIVNPGDFNCVQAGPYPVPNGTPQYVMVCNGKPGVLGTALLETTRPGYYQSYWGLDFSGTKRYSDKWMARFNFTYSTDTQHGLAQGQVDPSIIYGGGEIEGGAVATSSTASGAKGLVWINSKWQGTLSGMYTLPLDFNVSTSVFARQGYAAPYYRNLAVTGIPGVSSRNFQLGNIDDQRLPTVLEWDLGLAKVVKVGSLNVTLQADCFNVLNRNTALQRTLRVRDAAGAPVATNSLDNTLQEIQSPRIFRFGLRLAF
jgi:Carboxypeptidase regulatory-like domain